MGWGGHKRGLETIISLLSPRICTWSGHPYGLGRLYEVTSLNEKA